MTIQLKFKSPKELENLKEAKQIEKNEWHYTSDAGTVLELDTETWMISCPQNQQIAKINEWMVDETNFSMKLKTDDTPGDYRDIDYPFAVAMVGQLCPPQKLALYLKQLTEVFKMRPSSEGEEKKPSAPEDKPESREEPEEQTN